MCTSSLSFEFSDQTFVVAFVELDVAGRKRFLFSAVCFSVHQFRNVGQAKFFIQRDEIRLYLSGAHQMNACQQHPIDVEQRLDPRRIIPLEQRPLRRREPKIMMTVMPSYTT